MKIIILGDLHFISDHDPYLDVHERRRFFKNGWPSFKRMAQLIRQESPDLIISLGDIVDWYSPENVDFALNLLDEMDVPWVMTPGNHDMAGYGLDPLDPHQSAQSGTPGEKSDQPRRRQIPPKEYFTTAVQGWQERGIDLSDRVIDAGTFQLVLLNSSLGAVSPSGQSWLASQLAAEDRRFIVMSHVPVNTPPIVSYIRQVDPYRNLQKYTQQEAPHLYERYLKDRVEAVFTAHLHFSGRVRQGSTTFYMCPITIVPDGKTYDNQGTATVLSIEGTTFTTRTLKVDDS